MSDLRLSCEGIRLGTTDVPPFELRLGECICLHVPFPHLSTEEECLIEALTGRRLVSGLHLFGKVFQALPATNRKGVLPFFRRFRVGDWFRKVTGLGTAETRAVLDRLGLRAEWEIDQLAGTPKRLLGLEVVWARGAEAIIFDVAGLDPVGCRTVFEAVGARLDRCPAVYLSHKFRQNGQERRECFPGGICVEITARVIEPATSGQL